MIIGTPIERLDKFTLSLLSNAEIIDVNQDPLGKQACRQVLADGGEVLFKELEDGTRAAGLFNPGANDATVTVKWSDIGLKGKQKVRDLWRQKDLGEFPESFSVQVPSHGVVMVRLTGIK